MLADALTGGNLAFGIAAILLPGEGQTVRRSTFVLLGALCDTLDGPFARHSGNPTEFGAAADGVSDVITCGVAPAAILARCSTSGPRLSRIAPGFYMATAAWRLARYGIGPRQSHVFRGLPVTGAGILFALGCQLRLPPRALTYLAVALGIAMVSPMRVLSGEALVRRDLQSLTIELPDTDGTAC
jgi:CDP-diacylglycerol---serine O-phosphatidyltransferase